MTGSAVAAVRRARAEGLRPDTQLTVSAWADAHRHLPSKSSAEPGPWRTSRTPYLREIMDCLSATSLVEEVVLMKGAQVGGPLALDTPVATVAGWRTMADVEVADVVFDEHGQPTCVTGVSDVFTGHACYRLTFSDGSQLVADAAHRWFVESDRAIAHGLPGLTYPHRGRVPARLPRDYSGVLTTVEIAETFKLGNRNRYAIPVTKPLELPPAECLIDPYVLGVWLGDGHSYSTQVTQAASDADELSGHLADCGLSPEIVPSSQRGTMTIVLDRAEVSSGVCTRGHRLDDSGRTKRGHCAECSRQHTRKYLHGSEMDPVIDQRNGLAGRLAALGLLKTGRSRAQKHIPAHYLRASSGQRLALLQGLMDTDGTCGTNGRCEFSTTLPRLRDDVLELLWSLGLKPSVYESRARLKSGTTYQCRPGWRLSFIAYRDRLRVFKLRRKAARQPTTAGRRTTETERRRIVAVDPVESVPVRCLSVASPRNLFLAGRSMIPTHNSEVILNAIGYAIDHTPGPIILVQPTVELAKRFSRQRLDPLVSDTPKLVAKVARSKSRDSGNTILSKDFPGGQIIITGANSAVGLRSMPAQYAFMDEIDGYPVDVDEEGSPIALVEARQRTFARRKRIKVSTPTIAGRSAIESAYEASDQRRYYVPCPHCGEMQPLEWARVVWTRLGLPPSRAVYECRACEQPIQNHQKTVMLAAGEWRAEHPERDGKVRGYHLSALYAPVGWMSWGDIAVMFVAGHRDPEKHRVFINTVLGETWTSKGEAPAWEALRDRRETYAIGTVPMGALFLTCGVDVQKERVVYEIVGWGRGKRSWSIEKGDLAGDTADIDQGPYGQLDAMLARTYPHASGVEMPIRALAIDSGFNTQTVYGWARRKPMNRVMAVKGQDHGGVLVGSPSPVEVTDRGRKLKRGGRVWPVCVSMLKSELYGFLGLELGPDGVEPAGWCHFPQYDDEYFRQLTAEQLVAHKTRKGFIRMEWEIIAGRQNHGLDARNYARAAASLAGLDRMNESDWVAKERMMGVTSMIPIAPMATATTVATVATPARAPSAKPAWLSRRPGGSWLKGGR